MDHVISSVDAFEILDSRGNPTLRVNLRLSGGIVGTASVPSGASTGRLEAVELRDGDEKRYAGKGVTKAVANVNGEISALLKGCDVGDQEAIDRRMIEADGTENKARLGANAIVGVSMAVAVVAAKARGVPLYRHLAINGTSRLPVPMMNVMNGGAHADSSLDFQEFMLVPHGAPRFSEALRYGAETFHVLKGLLKERGLPTSVGDEGGFAPHLENNDAACDLIVEAVRHAGYEPGKDISIALDPAATSFAVDGGYDLSRSGVGRLTSEELNALYADWIERYPIVSVEDGFGEDDWGGFAGQMKSMGDRIQIVGDDLFVTNPGLIEKGIRRHAANAVLIKLNQIGTVTETRAAIDLCRRVGWNYVISHRSGETEDTFIADFAVAMGGGQIKTGSLTRSERLAKYNRLLEIERELGEAAVFEDPFAKKRIGRARSRPAHGLGAAAGVEAGSPLRVTALVPEAASCLDSLKAARAAAAIDPNTRITALHVQVDPRYLVTSAEELAMQQLRVRREGTSEERRDRTLTVYRDWLGSIDGKRELVEWRERVGAEEALVDEECANTDLVTIGKPRSLDGHDALHAALFMHRHLVLFAPPFGDVSEPVIGRSMAVAWKPTEATRNAIVRTMPWLKAADELHLITVARDDYHEAIDLLADNGLEPQVHVVEKGEGSVGDTVVACARSLRADSLVMGAYRYGEFIESMLGGVTHDILDHGGLPVFLVH